MSSTSTIPDLASTVIDLAKDIESLMASLYDLQMALINVTRSGPRSLSTDIHEIRSPLKDDWEEIRALLQCCHAFGGRAIMLKDVIRMGTDDLVETLSYFSETAVELVERSAKVIERSQAFAEWLTERVPKLYGILQQLSSSSPPSPRPAYGMAQPAEPWQIALPANGAALYNLFNWMQIRSRKPTVAEDSRADKARREFVEDSLAAIHPNGLKALSNTETATRNLLDALRMLHEFWEKTSWVCTQFKEASESGKHSITEPNAKTFSNAWKGYRVVLLQAASSITRSCDAVIQDATGAPLLANYRPNRLHDIRIRPRTMTMAPKTGEEG